MLSVRTGGLPGDGPGLFVSPTSSFTLSCGARLQNVCARKAPSVLFSKSSSCPRHRAPDTSLFLLGHHHGNQTTNLRRRHKNLLFEGTQEHLPPPPTGRAGLDAHAHAHTQRTCVIHSHSSRMDRIGCLSVFFIVPYSFDFGHICLRFPPSASTTQTCECLRTL